MLKILSSYATLSLGLLQNVFVAMPQV